MFVIMMGVIMLIGTLALSIMCGYLFVIDDPNEIEFRDVLIIKVCQLTICLISFLFFLIYLKTVLAAIS